MAHDLNAMVNDDSEHHLLCVNLSIIDRDILRQVHLEDIYSTISITVSNHDTHTRARALVSRSTEFLISSEIFLFCNLIFHLL
jgi:hypothetical protein